MKNILMHHNNGQPIYIALSDRMTFEVIYLGSAKSSHTSISAAIESATKEFINTSSSGESSWAIAEDWEGNPNAPQIWR